jgi:pimeloyl-ACP methyl ester carboxylesterase
MSDWFSGDVVANGINIHYHRTGGAKPPLVLSHGFTDSGLCWIRAAQALEADYDVIMPDARGHGRSDAPEAEYGDTDRAADLAGLIQALGLDRPALMGHSMGAATTALTAAKYPELVGITILEDPPWRDGRPGPSGEDRKARGQAWRAEIIEHQSQTREELLAFVAARSPAWDAIELGPWVDAKQSLNLRVFGSFATKRTPWREIVSQIRCPTLLVTADPQAGAIVTPQIAEQVTALNSSIQVVRIEGAGHNIRREQFEGFMTAVSAFLAKH